MLGKPLQMPTAAELNASCLTSCFNRYMVYSICIAVIVVSSWIITAMHEDCVSLTNQEQVNPDQDVLIRCLAVCRFNADGGFA